MVEIYFNIQSDNGTLDENHGLRRWSSHYLDAHEDDKDLRAPTRLKAMMETAGFTDIQNVQMTLPLSGWQRSS